jgi:hypothetical protein
VLKSKFNIKSAKKEESKHSGIQVEMDQKEKVIKKKSRKRANKKRKANVV